MKLLHNGRWWVLFGLVFIVGCTQARASQPAPGDTHPFKPTATRPPSASATAEPAPPAVEAQATEVAEPVTLYLPSVRVAVPSPTPEPTETAAAATATPSPSPEATSSPGARETLQLRSDLPALSLRDWPRPADDNGRGMHFLADQYFTMEELRLNVARLQQLGAKWTLVVYADENQLRMAAPVFAEAGIVPVWRKMLRPDEAYFGWERDISIIEAAGLPPYMQVYNEPSLPAEWDDDADRIDEERFLNNLMQASRDVYNAGGYVGWQFVNTEWLEHAITRVQELQGEALFGRLFFVPHPYGLNHPPSYTEDLNGALGFLFFADVFQRRIGRVPPMIAGEGGWKINASNDARYPPIDDAQHRDYHVEVFNWFRTGVLSNGQPLPDYLFAYCPWLISHRGDDNAWWDSFAGPRQATIEAVSQMPPFVRRFSWDQ